MTVQLCSEEQLDTAIQADLVRPRCGACGVSLGPLCVSLSMDRHYDCGGEAPERALVEEVLQAEPTNMLEAALALARAGWLVFPCREQPGEDAKRPYTLHGWKDATSSVAQVTAWWTWWPNAMIGSPVPSRNVVIDLDPRNGGTIEALTGLVGHVGPTKTAQSGGPDQGIHLYFLKPEGDLTSVKLPKGIDLRVGGKHYCIVPPSIHPDSGRPYIWINPGEAKRMPGRLRELLRPKPRPTTGWTKIHTGNGSGLIRHVSEAVEGHRDKSMFWACCRAVEQGILDEIEDQLVDAAMSVGLSEYNARQKVASARRTYASEEDS